MNVEVKVAHHQTGENSWELWWQRGSQSLASVYFNGRATFKQGTTRIGGNGSYASPQVWSCRVSSIASYPWLIKRDRRILPQDICGSWSWMDHLDSGCDTRRMNIGILHWILFRQPFPHSTYHAFPSCHHWTPNPSLPCGPWTDRHDDGSHHGFIMDSSCCYPTMKTNYHHAVVRLNLRLVMNHDCTCNQ